MKRCFDFALVADQDDLDRLDGFHDSVDGPLYADRGTVVSSHGIDEYGPHRHGLISVFARRPCRVTRLNKNEASYDVFGGMTSWPS